MFIGIQKYLALISVKFTMVWHPIKNYQADKEVVNKQKTNKKIKTKQKTNHNE